MVAKAKEYAAKYDGDEVPTIAGLACLLGVAKSTIYKWGDEDKEFSDTLDALQAKQEQVLISKGLNSSFNSTITKLMLANHGYSEKTQVEHGSSSELAELLKGMNTGHNLPKGEL